MPSSWGQFWECGNTDDSVAVEENTPTDSEQRNYHRRFHAASANCRHSQVGATIPLKRTLPFSDIHGKAVLDLPIAAG